MKKTWLNRALFIGAIIGLFYLNGITVGWDHQDELREEQARAARLST